ncbi:G2/mitotic-specific cyclin-B1, partial [Galemys pyrenaicus]
TNSLQQMQQGYCCSTQAWGNSSRDVMTKSATVPLERGAKCLADGKIFAKKLAKPLEKAPRPVAELESQPEPQSELESEPVKEKLWPEPVIVGTPFPSLVETSEFTPAGLYLFQALFDRALKMKEVDAEQHVLSHCWMELTMLNYNVVHFPPSQIVTRAFCKALKILSNPCLSYTKQSFLLLCNIWLSVQSMNCGLTKHTTIKNKYATSGHARICTPANCYISSRFSQGCDES